MSSEILNLMQRRQAIERGLQQYFNGTMLDRALAHWEQQYSGKPAFVLNRFLSEICTNDDLRLQRKEMLRQVLHEISVVEKQERLKVKTDKQVMAAETNPETLDLFQVFHDFVMGVLKGVSQPDYLDFVAEIQGKMKKNRLLAGYWYIAGSEKQCLMQMPKEVYAVMITTLYAIYCSFYGPGKADQLYAQIKHEIKQHYPAVDLSQLL